MGALPNALSAKFRSLKHRNHTQQLYHQHPSLYLLVVVLTGALCLPPSSGGAAKMSPRSFAFLLSPVGRERERRESPPTPSPSSDFRTSLFDSTESSRPYSSLRTLSSLAAAPGGHEWGMGEGEGDGGASQTGSVVVERQEGVRKPLRDLREYRHVRLKNGLRALLVSDPGTPLAAAAVDVKAGSWQDPEEMPGVAHFLEHLVFLGSEKFPEEGEFREFIVGHGGETNACTYGDHTNFHLSVLPNFLGQALERFADGLGSPLLSPSAIQREMQTVDAEYRGQKADEGSRMARLFELSALDQHPLSRFSTGNLQTLGGVEEGKRGGPEGEGLERSREALRSFWDQYYRAGSMSVCVVGNESLDLLEDLLCESFGKVRPGGDEKGWAQKAELNAYEFGKAGRVLKVVPGDSQRRLHLTFPLPMDPFAVESRPLDLVLFVLGWEGEGSLRSVLCREGLARHVSADVGWNYGDVSLLRVSVGLTDAGVERMVEVVEVFFQVVALLRGLLRSEGGRVKLSELWQNMKWSAETKFHIMSGGGRRVIVEAADLASQLRHTQTGEGEGGALGVLEGRSGASLPQSLDFEAVLSLLDSCITPLNLMVTVSDALLSDEAEGLLKEGPSDEGTKHRPRSGASASAAASRLCGRKELSEWRRDDFFSLRFAEESLDPVLVERWNKMLEGKREVEGLGRELKVALPSGEVMTGNVLPSADGAEGVSLNIMNTTLQWERVPTREKLRFGNDNGKGRTADLYHLPFVPADSVSESSNALSSGVNCSLENGNGGNNFDESSAGVGCLFLSIRSPHLVSSAEAVEMARLFACVVCEKENENLESLQMRGAEVSLEFSEETASFEVKMAGIASALPALIEALMARFSAVLEVREGGAKGNWKGDEEREGEWSTEASPRLRSVFADAYEGERLTFLDGRLDALRGPFSDALLCRSWSSSAFYSALADPERCCLERMAGVVREGLRAADVTALCGGTVAGDAGRELVRRALKVGPGRWIVRGTEEVLERPHRCVKVPRHPARVIVSQGGVGASGEDENSSVEVHFQIVEDDDPRWWSEGEEGGEGEGSQKGDRLADDEHSVLLKVLERLAAQSLFSAVRSDKRIAYHLGVCRRSVAGRTGLSVLVRSPLEDPVALEGAVEEWLIKFRNELEEMEDAEVQKFFFGVKATLRERGRLALLSGLGGSVEAWEEIVSRRFDFARTDRLAGIMRQMATATDGRAKKGLLTFFDRFLRNPDMTPSDGLPEFENIQTRTRRRKLVIQRWARAHAQARKEALSPSSPSSSSENEGADEEQDKQNNSASARNLFLWRGENERPVDERHSWREQTELSRVRQAGEPPPRPVPRRPSDSAVVLRYFEEMQRWKRSRSLLPEAPSRQPPPVSGVV
uniref:Peptidase M16 N-terminal domain-containing protein n=1 Tax=Chromera velia CCMP2878 TaxID=1169474 RepID=A0A0G4FVF0_9ALVE|eukprot:Cvel_18983.t1-p1 / transcript=Cvel_18983.t1 / gene=Cvel_18983 / organism=Chromera_velia_CCMP2878 / gene_product=Zinc-metallopeptidase, peroxisomal, putative / transcript_product=Zinc-metallopeptidase, peroxisomal, putative / location=Cvel_scaffold1605:34442-39773(+) / protein_length=1382 / sequence_SO=supercontig / SO=protein_coding / is_pseudo=false